MQNSLPRLTYNLLGECRPCNQLNLIVAQCSQRAEGLKMRAQGDSIYMACDGAPFVRHGAQRRNFMQQLLKVAQAHASGHWVQGMLSTVKRPCLAGNWLRNRDGMLANRRC